MNKNVVITIGRQFGSGGRYVGRLLAEKLGVPFYDKELLSEAAKNSGICEEIFEEHDEKPTRSLLFSLVTGMQTHMAAGNFYMDMPLNHKIFLASLTPSAALPARAAASSLAAALTMCCGRIPTRCPSSSRATWKARLPVR